MSPSGQVMSRAACFVYYLQACRDYSQPYSWAIYMIGPAILNGAESIKDFLVPPPLRIVDHTGMYTWSCKLTHCIWRLIKGMCTINAMTHSTSSSTFLVAFVSRAWRDTQVCTEAPMDSRHSVFGHRRPLEERSGACSGCTQSPRCPWLCSTHL